MGERCAPSSALGLIRKHQSEEPLGTCALRGPPSAGRRPPHCSGVRPPRDSNPTILQEQIHTVGKIEACLTPHYCERQAKQRKAAVQAKSVGASENRRGKGATKLCARRAACCELRGMTDDPGEVSTRASVEAPLRHAWASVPGADPSSSTI